MDGEHAGFTRSWRLVVAWCCLVAVLGFACLDAVHEDVLSVASAPASHPCLICQLAATAKPQPVHVQAPPFRMRVERLLLAALAPVPAADVARTHHIRPPPDAVSPSPC